MIMTMESFMILIALPGAIFDGEELVKNSDDTAGGYFDLELAPDSLANVPFGDGHVTVWKHRTSWRFYIRPLAYLLRNTMKCRYNYLTDRDELVFEILMTSQEVKITVANFLNQISGYKFCDLSVCALPNPPPPPPAPSSVIPPHNRALVITY